MSDQKMVRVDQTVYNELVRHAQENRRSVAGTVDVLLARSLNKSAGSFRGVVPTKNPVPKGVKAMWRDEDGTLFAELTKDVGDAFPDGLPYYDGSGDEEADDGEPFSCPQCGWTDNGLSDDPTGKAARYRRLASETSDPALRQGYLACAGVIEKRVGGLMSTLIEVLNDMADEDEAKSGNPSSFLRGLAAQLTEDAGEEGSCDPTAKAAELRRMALETSDPTLKKGYEDLAASLVKRR